MWTSEHVLATSATVAEVWPRYSEPTTWPEWDQPRSTVAFAGPFETGAKGTLTIKGGRASRFTLTEVEEFSGYTDRSRFGLSRITISHRITPAATGVVLTHTVTMTGPFSRLVGSLLGARISRQQAGALRRLVALLEAAGPARGRRP